MNAPKFMVLLAGMILAVCLVSVAVSAPPSPPPSGAFYPLAYNPSAAPVALSADQNGGLLVDDSVGSLLPAVGNVAFTPAPTTCYHPKTTAGAVLTLTLVDPNQLGSGNTIDLFDEGSGGTCTDGDRIYSAGNIGAGAIIGLNLQLQTGLAFRLVGSRTWVTGYGIRFKVVP